MPEGRGGDERPTAPRVVAEVAAEQGVRSAFGIVSVHNLPLVDALAEAGRYTPVRHEATAVNAADGYSRVAESLGMAVTSTGTGAGNAAGSLVEALTAGSRVLHLTGNIDTAYLGRGRGVIHETKAQDRMLEAVSKAHHTVTSAADIEPTIRLAIHQALTAPTGPVSVELPIDLQYSSSPSSAPSRAAADTDGEEPAIEGDLERAVDALNRAERPLIWAGGGAIGARDLVAELARRFAIPVLTSNAGRGVLPEDDPLVVGNFAATTSGQELLDRADLLVSIGTHFRSNETRHYKLRLPAAHIQIDVDPAAIGRAYPCQIGLVGRAATVVAALVDRLAPTDRPAWREAVSATRAEVRRQLEHDIGPYAELCRAMRTVLPDESPLVRDVTIPSSSWGNRLLPILDPTTNVNARGGGIGQGLGMAIGAATARRGVPTGLMVGDGGLAVHLGELATVAQEQLPVVVIVFDDGGYGVLRNTQDAHVGRRSGVDLVGPDLRVLAEAFSLPHHRLADPADSLPVLERAVAGAGPALVEVDCAAFGPMPVPFVPPVPVPSGAEQAGPER
jgi:acetolactate synthase-1/2/3 large subunit